MLFRSDGETQHTYEATIVARGANRARIDGGKSQYMRDLIWRTPSVSFTPEDQRLVAGDPATRRNFINQAASLLLPHYAQTLQQFTHVAKQRTARAGSGSPWILRNSIPACR